MTTSHQSVTRQPAYLSSPMAASWHQYIYDHFPDVISTPSYDAIQKEIDRWVILGDHRGELATAIESLVPRYGLGVASAVLHAQQLTSRQIPTELEVGGQTVRLG